MESVNFIRSWIKPLLVSVAAVLLFFSGWIMGEKRRAIEYYTGVLVDIFYREDGAPMVRFHLIPSDQAVGDSMDLLLATYAQLARFGAATNKTQLKKGDAYVFYVSEPDGNGDRSLREVVPISIVPSGVASFPFIDPESMPRSEHPEPGVAVSHNKKDLVDAYSGDPYWGACQYVIIGEITRDERSLANLQVMSILKGPDNLSREIIAMHPNWGRDCPLLGGLTFEDIQKGKEFVFFMTHDPESPKIKYMIIRVAPVNVSTNTPKSEPPEPAIAR